MILSNGQQRIVEELLLIAQVAILEDTSNLPIQPRTHSLICGPSGSGKTYLMQSMARILKVPLLYINASTWVPIGGKGGNPTWANIVEFLESNTTGIILLDEVDKIGSETSDWLEHVRLEIYDLLDGRIPKSIESYKDTTNLW